MLCWFKGNHKKTGAEFECKVCADYECAESGDYENPKLTITCKSNALAFVTHLGLPGWSEARTVMFTIESSSLVFGEKRCPECKNCRIKYGKIQTISGTVNAVVLSSYQMWSGRNQTLRTDETVKSNHSVKLDCEVNCCGCKDLCEG